MFRIVRKFVKNESGATAIEYGLIAALVSVAAIGALTQVGGSLKSIFGVVSTNLDAAATSAQSAGGGSGTGTGTGTGTP
jgi:pilus assembly protein Flp/PilA